MLEIFGSFVALQGSSLCDVPSKCSELKLIKSSYERSAFRRA